MAQRHDEHVTFVVDPNGCAVPHRTVREGVPGRKKRRLNDALPVPERAPTAVRRCACGRPAMPGDYACYSCA